MDMTAKECILKFVIDSIEYIDNVPDGVLPSDHWDKLVDDGYEDELNDELIYGFRDSGEKAELPCEFSRYYESYTMARDLGVVSVAWTYWYGGGKHGEPESIDWLEGAYFVNCEKVVKTVNVFSKIEGK